MKTIEILISVCICLGVGYYCGLSSSDNELQALQIEKTKLSIELLKREPIPVKSFLTVDDLKSIYACVDTKIHNKNNKVKFPCVAVRGDSF